MKRTYCKSITISSSESYVFSSGISGTKNDQASFIEAYKFDDSLITRTCSITLAMEKGDRKAGFYRIKKLELYPNNSTTSGVEFLVLCGWKHLWVYTFSETNRFNMIRKFANIHEGRTPDNKDFIYGALTYQNEIFSYSDDCSISRIEFNDKV